MIFVAVKDHSKILSLPSSGVEILPVQSNFETEKENASKKAIA